MWAMGKVTKTPEVLRVYTGSFWDQPLQYPENAKLFEQEEKDLMTDLKNLPRNSAIRKINELVKRCRKAKVHAYIIAHLRSEMPSLTGKARKQEKLIADLPAVFRAVMKKHALAAGDFPEIDRFRTKLQELNFTKFPKLNVKMMESLDKMLSTDIPKLMDALPTELLSVQAMGEFGQKVEVTQGNVRTNCVKEREKGRKRREGSWHIVWWRKLTQLN